MSKTKADQFVRKTEKCWQGSQSVFYEALYHYGKHRLKIDIRRDFYDNQSYLRVKVFDPETVKWNVLVSDAMTDSWACYRCRSGQRDVSTAPFRLDAEKMLEEARLVLDD